MSKRDPQRTDTGKVVTVAGMKLRVLKSNVTNDFWGYPADDPGPTLSTLVYIGDELPEGTT